jgi:Fe-S-cluster containining protein
MRLQVRYHVSIMLILAPPNFREIVYRAAGRAEVRAAVFGVYGSLQQEIVRQKPRCDVSGRCCRFQEYGHELFVTTAEIATFIYELELGAADPGRHRGIQYSPACPFQRQTVCTVHAIRPFGCRIYFCDPAASQWQREQYERLHARLKAIHQELQVPYAYLEWRRALEAVEL